MTASLPEDPVPLQREKNPPSPTFRKGGFGGFESYFLTSFHPETPSPLAGEGWGEGEQIRGGGEKWGFRMDTN